MLEQLQSVIERMQKKKKKRQGIKKDKICRELERIISKWNAVGMKDSQNEISQMSRLESSRNTIKRRTQEQEKEQSKEKYDIFV